MLSHEWKWCFWFFTFLSFLVTRQWNKSTFFGQLFVLLFFFSFLCFLIFYLLYSVHRLNLNFVTKRFAQDSLPSLFYMKRLNKNVDSLMRKYYFNILMFFHWFYHSSSWLIRFSCSRLALIGNGFLLTTIELDKVRFETETERDKTDLDLSNKARTFQALQLSSMMTCVSFFI